MLLLYTNVSFLLYSIKTLNKKGPFTEQRLSIFSLSVRCIHSSRLLLRFGCLTFCRLEVAETEESHCWHEEKHHLKVLFYYLINCSFHSSKWLLVAISVSVKCKGYMSCVHFHTPFVQPVHLLPWDLGAHLHEMWVEWVQRPPTTVI